VCARHEFVGGGGAWGEEGYTAAGVLGNRGNDPPTSVPTHSRNSRW
jgi:hypothetical protein